MADDLKSSIVDKLKAYEDVLSSTMGAGWDYLSGQSVRAQDKNTPFGQLVESRVPTQNNIEEFLTDMITHYRKLPSELPDNFREAIAYLRARYQRFSNQASQIRISPTIDKGAVTGYYDPDTNNVGIAFAHPNETMSAPWMQRAQDEITRSITHEMTHARQASKLGGAENVKAAFKQAKIDAAQPGATIPSDIPLETYNQNPGYWGSKYEVGARSGGQTGNYGYRSFMQDLPGLTEQLHPQQQLNFGILRDILRNKAPASNPWMQLRIP